MNTVTTTGITGNTWTIVPAPAPATTTCPACGHCPTCGRGHLTLTPIYPMPATAPWWQGPFYCTPGVPYMMVTFTLINTTPTVSGT